MKHRHPPGPNWFQTISQVWLMEHKPYEYLRRLSIKYGPLVRVNFPVYGYYLITDPKETRRILGDSRKWSKYTRLYKFARQTVGEGIFMTEGERWQEQKKLAAPYFSPAYINARLPQLEELTRETAMRMQGQPDVWLEVSRYTLSVLLQVSLGLSKDVDAIKIAHQLDRLIRRFATAFTQMIPLGLPLPLNRRFFKGKQELARSMDELLEQDVQEGMLAAIKQQFPNDRERQYEEVAAQLVAGVETTTSALIWGLHFLTAKPEYQQHLRQEADLPLSERKHSLHFWQETLRYYPPLWGNSRRAEQDNEVLGYHIPKGAMVILSPYLCQHLPKEWKQSESFCPHRFAEGAADKDAYMPYGTGQRACMGRHLANAEGLLLLGELCKHYSIKALYNTPPKLDNGMRPATALALKFTPINK